MDAAAVEQLFKRLPGLRPDEVPAEVELTELRAAAMDCAHDGEATVVVQLDVPQLERLQRAVASQREPQRGGRGLWVRVRVRVRVRIRVRVRVRCPCGPGRGQG